MTCFTHRTRRLLNLVALAAFASWTGCASYRFGTETLYRPDIATVYVPVFESDSFRRHLGARLTEAVVKEIEQKTPYKVVGGINADSTLTGRIVSEYKRPIADDAAGFPRDIDIGMVVEVSWRDHRGELLGQQFALPMSPFLLSVGEAENFIPEAGQSLTVAQQETIVGLAEQIVAQMEAPW